MKKKAVIFILNILVSVITLAAPKYVFMFIGDGLGAAQRQIAEYYMTDVEGGDGKLLMNRFPVAGINTTHSLNTLVTDSAAAGTALATGHKTNNGMISMLPSGKKVESIAQYAGRNGMKTGLVTTTRLTHATPAVFASNNVSRGNENEIADDFVKSGIDFFAGGGYRNFIPQESKGAKRKDSRDLGREFKREGYEVFIGEESVDDFMNLKARRDQKVFAALTSSHMPYEVDRVNSRDHLPSLADMTRKGIEVLSQGEKGFFMMVEAGRIDHAAHANDAASVIHDTLALDRAVGEAYEFYEKHPEETLIVVVGDHETGGMGLGYGKNYFLKLDALKDVRASVDDVLQRKYDGNRKAYFDFIGREMGLGDLSVEERESIVKAMDIEDSGDYDSALFGDYTPTSVATAHVLAKRSNTMFTTYAHTGTQIPLSAVGRGAEKFSGFIDNTEIAETMIEMVR
jgi:alkaline phosphatase